jgi:hypothetical protein
MNQSMRSVCQYCWIMVRRFETKLKGLTIIQSEVTFCSKERPIAFQNWRQLPSPESRETQRRGGKNYQPGKVFGRGASLRSRKKREGG